MTNNGLSYSCKFSSESSNTSGKWLFKGYLLLLGDCRRNGGCILVLGFVVELVLIADGVLLSGVIDGVDGYFGGVDDGVRNSGKTVMWSKNVSNCFNERALCNVSKGRIGGTPPKPSIAIRNKQRRRNVSLNA